MKIQRESVIGVNGSYCIAYLTHTMATVLYDEVATTALDRITRAH